jgi:hypothetical protein
MIHIAILYDCQNVSLKMADCSPLQDASTAILHFFSSSRWRIASSIVAHVMIGTPAG